MNSEHFSGTEGTDNFTAASVRVSKSAPNPGLSVPALQSGIDNILAVGPLKG